MATGVETKIYEGLASHLASLTLTPTMPIAWPNLKFSPTGGHLRVSPLPAASERPSINNEVALRRGIFQVSVYWPENEGLTAPLERASSIVAHFDGVWIIREGITIRNIATPYPAAPLQEPGWIQIPVTIPYLAITPNA